MISMLTQLLWIIATIMIFFCGIYFCFKLKFIHLNFKKMIKEIIKKNKGDNSISSFEALSISLAGRIGVGSLSGIALAIYLGGPGVIFWIWVTSIFCATNTFAESVLAVVFRKKDVGNIYRGGPFYYIFDGLKNKKLAIVYAILILFIYILGFMTIQVNTVTKCLVDVLPVEPIVVGFIIAIITGITILGGVKRIANITSKLVPFMTAIFFIVCTYIILKNFYLLPQVFIDIFNSALNFKTFGLGVISTLLIGMQKGIFSSELGLGTGTIAGVTADTDVTASNGMVQTFGIHFENLFIATITSIVICMSHYKGITLLDPNGIEITLLAFQEFIGKFGSPFITIVITLFGISSILTIYYYCESSLKFIKNANKLNANKLELTILKITILVMIILGSVFSSKGLWAIADLLTGIIAIINIYAVFKLRNIVIEEYNYYKYLK